jgi:hypothetical protein
MDAVRFALQDRGNDAKPLELQAFIREKYGIEMTIDHISAYKTVLLRKAKEGRKRSRVADTPVGESHPLNGAAPRTPPQAASLADQVAKLKEVAAAIGKGEAKKILDLL